MRDGACCGKGHGVCQFPWRMVFSLGLVFSAATSIAQNYTNFEAKLTRPICLSPDGTKLFAVNTADARLSVFDVTHPLNPFLIAEIPVGVEPVSVNARNNDEVWVVNEVSDSVSIVSLSRRMVVDTIYVKDEPADVVFAGGKAFVSESRNNQIAVFDAGTHALLTNIAVFGEGPRSLAVNSNETKIYAAFALSGNRTTLIPPTNAPPQVTNGVPPMNPSLPPPPKVGLIVDATDPAWTNIIRYTMPDNDVVEIDVSTMTISRYFSGVGTLNFAMAVQPGSGDLFVANMDARNLTHFESNLRGFFYTNRFAHIDITSGDITNFDLNAGYHPTNFTLLDRTNALAQPMALVFGSGGAEFYLAAFGSDRVARIEADSGYVATRIELCPTAVGSAADPRHKRGPRGLALMPGAALYVLNRISGTISIVDPTIDSVVREIPIGSFDPTPAVIRNGRGFLYDAKLSGNGTVSCSSCHLDAEMDLLAWDLGDPQGSLISTFTGIFNNQPIVFHPMKGPLVTQTLRNLDSGPFHWRGDRTNFTFFNGTFRDLLGGSTLSTEDINAFRDFINTIAFEPNPNQTLSRKLPASVAGGNPSSPDLSFRIETLGCINCHNLGTSGGGPLINHFDGIPVKGAQFRNLYQKTSLNRGTNTSSIGGFGFFQDGRFADLIHLDHLGMGFADMQAFLLCFDTDTAPAVGYTLTLASTNVTVTSVSNEWAILEDQTLRMRNSTNIDLIIKGRIDGQFHGLLYQRGSNTYLLDTTNAAPLTRSQLVAKIQAGDVLTVMGVPFGTGRRLGIDRDLNGVLDADEPLPRLQIAAMSDKTVVQWPLSATGFQLEETGDLTLPWNVSNEPVEIVNGLNCVTNNAVSTAQFFRLRKL